MTVEYQYCRTCGGQRTGRIEYDENDEVTEWLRYEMDGLNHLRIDEVYDADSNGELEDPAATGDAWRVQRVYVNGPGQLGQIAKVIVYNYASATTNTVASEEVYYYHYDILGNVSVISDPNGDEADQFEQDAFGNLVSGSWSGRVGGITEQITTKPYDADLGQYYFNARWDDPQVGAFISTAPLPRHAEHPYSFSEATPTTRTDPTGRCSDSTSLIRSPIYLWYGICLGHLQPHPRTWPGIDNSDQLPPELIDAVSCICNLFPASASDRDSDVHQGIFANIVAAHYCGHLSEDTTNRRLQKQACMSTFRCWIAPGSFACPSKKRRGPTCCGLQQVTVYPTPTPSPSPSPTPGQYCDLTPNDCCKKGANSPPP